MDPSSISMLAQQPNAPYSMQPQRPAFRPDEQAAYVAYMRSLQMAPPPPPQFAYSFDPSMMSMMSQFPKYPMDMQPYFMPQFAAYPPRTQAPFLTTEQHAAMQQPFMPSPPMVTPLHSPRLAPMNLSSRDSTPDIEVRTSVHSQQASLQLPKPAYATTHMHECNDAHHQHDLQGDNPAERVQCQFPGCGRTYGNKSYLECHMRVHTGARPYVCEIQGCGKALQRSDEFTRHMRKHTGEKPFACAYCGRLFARSDHMMSHTRTHTGEKPYQCTLTTCGRRFARSDELSRHMRTHTKHLSKSTAYPADPVSAPILPAAQPAAASLPAALAPLPKPVAASS